MSDEDVQRERLMWKRARALAVLTLTRRKDLTVEDMRDDAGIDLVAQLAAKPSKGLRQFGIKLWYVLDPLPEMPGRDQPARVRMQAKMKRANDLVAPVLTKTHKSGPFPFPVVLFFFNMRNPSGLFTWVAKPVLSDGDRPHLMRVKTPDCRRLDDEAVEEIVRGVDAWYDAYYTDLEMIAPSATREKKR